MIGTGIGTAAHVTHEGYLSYKYVIAYTLRLDVAVPPTESSALEAPLSSLKEWFDYVVALRAISILASYNEAHDLLFKEAYPYPEEAFWVIDLPELKYKQDGKAKDILKAYMEDKNVAFCFARPLTSPALKDGVPTESSTKWSLISSSGLQRTCKASLV